MMVHFGALVFVCAVCAGHAIAAADAKTSALAFANATVNGDIDGVMRELVAEGRQEELLRPVLGEILMNAGRFEQVMRATYGKAAAGEFGVAPSDETKAWAAAVVRDGRVTLAFDKKSVDLTLVRSENRWKVGFPAAFAYLEAKGIPLSIPGDEPLRRWAAVSDAFRQATQDVRKGQHTDAKTAAAAARQAVQEALDGRGFN